MSEITTLAEGLAFPEGPIALADGSVIVCEIAGERVTRVAPDGTLTVLGEVPGGPNGLALGPDGAIYICNNGGGFGFKRKDGITRPNAWPPNYSGGRIERLDRTTGALTTLCDEADGVPILMPNDLVFDRRGGFYFTDFGKRSDRAIQLGGLYYGRPGQAGAVELVHGVITPNGVGLSPDESRVYMATTETGRMMVYDVLEPGKVTRPTASTVNQSVLAQFEGVSRYDSLAVEENGNICVGNLAPGNITVISPEGKLVENVPMPDPLPTNIAFGGPDMRTAFITLSGSGRLVSMRWPRPGLRLNFQDA